MTKHAEIIFEPGSKSVMSYESEDELKEALKEHHNRAINGRDGGPAGLPAERITKVYTYSDHPADLWPDTVSADTVNKLTEGMGPNIDPNQLIAALRDEVSPVYPNDQGKHESMYKAEGTALPLKFLDGTDDGGDL